MSVGASDFLASLTLSGGDSSGDLANGGHSVLSFLELGDGDVGGVDGELVGGSVGLIFSEFIDVNGPFLPEDLDDFTLCSLVGASHDDYLVVLSDWGGSDAVLLPQIL